MEEGTCRGGHHELFMRDGVLPLVSSEVIFIMAFILKRYQHKDYGLIIVETLLPAVTQRKSH